MLNRRRLLAGAAGLAGLAALGACSSDDEDSGPEPTASDGSRYSLVAFFGGPLIRTGIVQRATYGIGDAEGALLGADGLPDELEFRITREGSPAAEPIMATRHADGIPRGYFPLRFTAEEPGVYEVTTEIDGEQPPPAALEIYAADEVVIPQVGDPMPVIDTPTVGENRGVDPICTREPPCPLHEANLRDLRAAAVPTVVLISTPAYCATAICGPVLDVLLGETEPFRDRVGFVHAEVYQSGAEASEEVGRAATTEAVRQMRLHFEPCLVGLGADGTITHRLDTIFDAVELQRVLTELTA